MKKQYFNQTKWFLFLVPVLALCLFAGCGDDDPVGGGGGTGTTTDNPIASFQYEIDANDFLTVRFSNFSQNATSYSWNFGDGNTSTEESPTHIYDAAGSYTVELTATGAAGTTASTKVESFTINDPDTQLALLAGSDSKTWYLLREGVALGIGPVLNDNAWWSFGGVTPLGDRPCILDDAYTFFRDGSYTQETGGTVFVDAAANGGWKENEGCFDESDPDAFTHFSTGEDLSDFANGGNYSYTFDDAAGVLSIDGLGSYIGLPVKTNAGDNYLPINNHTYTIINFVDGGDVDSLALGLEGDGFSWNFYLVSYENDADIPEIPSAQPRAAFDSTKEDLTVTFINQSANATSYSWDFGDGGSSSDKDPTHTYATSGDYDVTLSVEDGLGNMDMTTKTVSVSDAAFNAAALSNIDGKVWRLAGEASYKVGPTPGSGEWWGGIDAAGVDQRACQLDDEFIFVDGGSFITDAKDAIWAENYLGGMDECIPSADVPAPFDVFTGGMFSYEVLDATADEIAKIRVVGTGAYLGFNKPFNGGELAADATGTPASEITYDLISYSSTDEKEELVLVIDYIGDGSGYWTITLESLK